MKAPSIYKLKNLQIPIVSENLTNFNGLWLPARPEGFYSIGNRLKCAWLAFTGKCDLVEWPGEQ